MDSGYTEKHKSDNVYTLLSEIEYNARLKAYREKDSLNRDYTVKDRTVFMQEAKEYGARANWCIEQVQNIIGRLRNEASAPVALRAASLDVLKEALCPPVQDADSPHFTEAHVEMLDAYFYLVPKENPDWIPSADEMCET